LSSDGYEENLISFVERRRLIEALQLQLQRLAR
jgi:hypothetical protein